MDLHTTDPRFPGYDIIQRYQTYVHGFELVMNSIYGRCEDVTTVAIAQTHADLVKWYEDQLCDPWKESMDGRTYTKSFKKDSYLENFNPVTSLDPKYHGTFGDGIHEGDFLVDDFPVNIYIVPHP